jgi:hypothetical protein
MEIRHKVVLFQEWDSGSKSPHRVRFNGSILAKEIELPFAPFPGLRIRICQNGYGCGKDEDDVTVNVVIFRIRTGTFPCEAESCMGNLIDMLGKEKETEFDHAYEHYLSLDFRPTCGLSVLGDPYEEWDGSFFKKSDGSWFPGQEPPKAVRKPGKAKR